MLWHLKKFQPMYQNLLLTTEQREPKKYQVPFKYEIHVEINNAEERK